MNRIIKISGICFLLAPALAWAQAEKKEKAAVTYEELYDEPYSVNKLFVGFQPFYGEVFATNVNAGFGVEASYFHKEKIDFRAHFRKTYSRQFYDFARDLAYDNTPRYDNGTTGPGNITKSITTKPVPFAYFEAGATYHVKDFESSTKTKMVLYKKSYKGNKWASRVPLHSEVPCKVRKIYGVRFGGIYWQSTTDVGNALKKQEKTNADLKSVSPDAVPASLPLTFTDPVSGQESEFNVYGNIHSANAYLGGSFSWIKNVAVSFDKFEEGMDDGMFTAFVDLIYAPMLTMDNISYIDPTSRKTNEYSTKAVSMNPIGFRLGVDGKFNRTLSWGYGGEMGYRPSVKGRSFFMMFKISLPLYGTNLDYKVESFGK